MYSTFRSVLQTYIWADSSGFGTYILQPRPSFDTYVAPRCDSQLYSRPAFEYSKVFHLSSESKNVLNM